MQASSEDISNWPARLKAELKRDKKKTAVLAVLLAVAGIIGGRLIVTARLPGGAQAAGGSVEPAEPVDPADAAPKEPPGGAAKSTRLSETERQEFLARLDRTITRNLFRVNVEAFPPERGVPAGTQPLASDDQGQTGMFQQVNDWLTHQQSAERQQRERVAAVQAQAQALSLQSMMLGHSPTALINGQVLRKDEWISGFRVKSIDGDSCVVTKDGVDVQLRMKN